MPRSRRKTKPVQRTLAKTAGWGGRRTGAGRPPGPGRRSVSHHARPTHSAAHPLHLTLRACAGMPTLRGFETYPAIQAALAAANKPAFRVIAFSVQQDHMHLVVEASDKVGLSRGVQGLCVRLARAFNGATARKGRVFGDRYHARALRTPREVRFALIYVLHNVKKHEPSTRFAWDPCCSAPWFDGMRNGAPLADGPTRAPRTWLLRVGWRRHGLLTADDSPLASPRSTAR